MITAIPKSLLSIHNSSMSKAGQWLLLTLLILTEVLWPDRERSLRECHQMSPLSERDHCTQATPRGRFVRVAVRPMSSHLKRDSCQQTEWILHVKNWNARGDTLVTTLQSVMNAKLSKQRFWHCFKNGLIKTIQTISHNLHVSVKLTSLYCGLRLILVYPNPQ